MWTGLTVLSLDLDDTLWDVEPVLVRAETKLSAWLGEHYPRVLALHEPLAARARRAEVAARYPHRAHDLSFVRTESLRLMALEAGYEAGIAEEAFRVFHAARNDVRPYDEVPAALERLGRRYTLAALTNGNADIARTPLAAHFRFGVSPVDAGVAKPDPRIFEHLFTVAAVRPSQVLHVGDDPVTDVAGARAAGCRSVWLNRRGSEWPSGLARADAEVSDLAGLAELLADQST
jgi:putative hydrolase of the HAD superfamily